MVTIHHERVATAVVLVLLITIMNQAEGVAELMPPPPARRATATATGLLVPRMHILKKNLLMLMKTVMLLAKVKNTVKASLL